MKEATFIISNTDFSDWRMANSKVDKIIISGTATFKQAKDFAKAFEYSDYKKIILNDFSIIDKIVEGDEISFVDDLGIKIEIDMSIIPEFYKIYLNHITYGLSEFVVKNDWIFSKDETILIHPLPVSKLVVPENIKHIGAGACCGYGMLTHLHLNEGLESIDNYAFVDTGIMELEMPDSVTTLGCLAFCGCDNLKKIKLSENLTEIPHECFCYVDLEFQKFNLPPSIKTLGYESLPSYIGEITIPEGIVEIDDYIVNTVKYVSLPSTLKKIAPDFYYDYYASSPQPAPFVEVHKDNPVFYSDNGNLYFRDSCKCALDAEYNAEEWDKIQRYCPFSPTNM